MEGESAKPPGSGVVIGRAGGKTRGAGQGWSVLLGSAMAIVLGLTACGGGSPRSLGAAAGGSTTTAQPASSSGSSGSSAVSLGLTYARCMRSHGVPNFPDPSAGGGLKTAFEQHRYRPGLACLRGRRYGLSQVLSERQPDPADPGSAGPAPGGAAQVRTVHALGMG